MSAAVQVLPYDLPSKPIVVNGLRDLIAIAKGLKNQVVAAPKVEGLSKVVHLAVAVLNRAFPGIGSVEDNMVEAAYVAAHRAFDPSSRAESAFRYVINTGRRARRDRIDGGWTGVSWCNAYPRTVASSGDEVRGTKDLVDEVRFWADGQG